MSYLQQKLDLAVRQPGPTAVPVVGLEACSGHLGSLSRLLLLSLLEPLRWGSAVACPGPRPCCRRGLARLASAWSSGWPRPLRLCSLIASAL